MKITFHINSYDHEGDVWDKAIFIHLTKDTIIRLESLKDLSSLITSLQKCEKEIKDNYNFQ
jgi:hypothetical protein